MATLFTWFPAIRDRALADPAFLFKLGAEVWGDVGPSVASELKARNTNASVFSDEAEFFFADVLASAALNAATLTMLRPTVVFACPPEAGARFEPLTARREAQRFPAAGVLPRAAAAFLASAFQKGNFTTANRAATAFAGRARRRRLRAGRLRGASRRQRGVPRAPQVLRLGLLGRVRRLHPPRGAAAAGAGGGVGAHMAVSGNIRQQLIIGIESPSRRARSAPRRRAARARRAALRAEQRLGGAAFAEKMRLMEAEVYARTKRRTRKEKRQEVIYR